MSEVTPSAAPALDREVMPAPDPCAPCVSNRPTNIAVWAFRDKIKGVVTVSAILSLDFVESSVKSLPLSSNWHSEREES